MLLTKYDPFKELKAFENRFSDLFKPGSEDTLTSFDFCLKTPHLLCLKYNEINNPHLPLDMLE
jgi:hypothetical protein